MKTLLLVAILITICSTCYASSLEIDRFAGQTAYQLCLEKPVAPHVGVFGYANLCQGWSEAYVGGKLSGSWYEIALGQGVETGGSRTGGWVWIGKNRVSAIFCAENGHSGPWQKFETKYQLTKKLSIGFESKSFRGKGFLAEVCLDKTTKIKAITYNSGRTEVALITSF